MASPGAIQGPAILGLKGRFPTRLAIWGSELHELTTIIRSEPPRGKSGAVVGLEPIRSPPLPWPV